MSSHYFDKSPDKESEERIIKSYLRRKNMTFKSDHSVFSKREVDFGSKTLLEAFEWPDAQGDILDIGCGYGPIGITLAKETERTVWLADVNERAVSLSKKNAAYYGLQNIKIVESDLFSGIQARDFAAIVTNPPIRAGKKVIHSLFEQAHAHLQKGGEFWVVIQKKQGAPSAKEKLGSHFEKIETVKKNKGYHIFCAKKS
ncbi:class I SAM-dependent methyltransferase [Alteribacillus bidgolensis]|uniref:16S rRNA m(2)G 1207 methyltransferase n=1 Tax=Alteribacillus bidgolensis TaxID=930129 RepID=A0A1G8PEX1_9BACI|nr:class I SAM-dependent methyltransferase [Alteribacillus bidgolensis]SDI91044.1 16S rRNA m(2)G 1207 methyltransferase [Alteribacillus bidgolensis]